MRDGHGSLKRWWIAKTGRKWSNKHPRWFSTVSSL